MGGVPRVLGRGGERGGWRGTRGRGGRRRGRGEWLLRKTCLGAAAPPARSRAFEGSAFQVEGLGFRQEILGECPGHSPRTPNTHPEPVV